MCSVNELEIAIELVTVPILQQALRMFFRFQVKLPPSEEDLGNKYKQLLVVEEYLLTFKVVVRQYCIKKYIYYL